MKPNNELQTKATIFRYPFMCYTTQRNIQHGRHGHHNLHIRVRTVSWKPSIGGISQVPIQLLWVPSLSVHILFLHYVVFDLQKQWAVLLVSCSVGGYILFYLSQILYMSMKLQKQ